MRHVQVHNGPVSIPAERSSFGFVFLCWSSVQVPGLATQAPFGAVAIAMSRFLFARPAARLAMVFEHVAACLQQAPGAPCPKPCRLHKKNASGAVQQCAGCLDSCDRPHMQTQDHTCTCLSLKWHPPRCRCAKGRVLSVKWGQRARFCWPCEARSVAEGSRLNKIS